MRFRSVIKWATANLVVFSVFFVSLVPLAQAQKVSEPDVPAEGLIIDDLAGGQDGDQVGRGHILSLIHI